MADARAQRGTEQPPQNGCCRKALKVVSFCLKAAVVLFPIPAALLTRAPQEMVGAAIYVTLVTAAGFLAMWEIVAGLNRLNETLAERPRSS